MLAGKRILVCGVANNKSIAAAIAKCAVEEGAEVALTYQSELLLKRVKKVADELNITTLVECDVSSDEQISECFVQLKKVWPEGFDGLVHSIAFAGTDQFDGKFIDAVTREGMSLAVDVSAYSLVGLCKYARGMLREGASVLTLTYIGSTRYLPSYNTMGVAKAALESCVRYLAASLGKEKIRVNSISAGAIKTLAASAVKNFNSFLHVSEKKSLLGRLVKQEDVGKAAVFLLSDYSSAITAENIMVDAGVSVTMAEEID